LEALGEDATKGVTMDPNKKQKLTWGTRKIADKTQTKGPNCGGP